MSIRLGPLIFGALLATFLPGQGEDKGGDNKQDKNAHKAATRLVRHLELPSHRAKSATALVRLGKKAVPALIQGLADPRHEIIERIASVLRAIGEDARPAIPALQRVAEEKNAKRARAARWALAPFHPQGITLVAEYLEHRIVEFDRDGKEVFEIEGLAGIFDAERLPNGRYLVVMYNRGVQEIDRKGKVYWEFKEITKCLRASRLASGNTLICANNGGGVIEVDPKGKVVWKFDIRSPYAAERLANGNTLIADLSGHRVIEVTPAGKIIWTCDKAKSPADVDRLPNGNTLISSLSGSPVIEVDARGEIVRKLGTRKQTYAAVRLANGDTVVGGSGFLHRYDSKGKEIWSVDVKLAISVRHY